MATTSSKQPVEAQAFLARLRSANFPDAPTAAPHEDIADTLAPCLQGERERRALWAQDKDNKALKDPYVGLIDLHGDGTFAADGSSVFRTRKRLTDTDSTAERVLHQDKPGGPRSDPTRSDVKHILALPEWSRREHGSPAVEAKSDFKRNFDIFTEGAFSSFTPDDWSGVLIAGGAVLAAATKVPEKYRNSKRELRRWYHEESTWKCSDVDVFLYGMDEETAKKKLVRLAAAVADGVPWDTLCVRSKNTVTLVSQYPYRHIQFVLRLYSSPAEILQGFDVDASGFGYDGSRVWATPRAVASLLTQCNTIDMTRRSPSYEQRLAKYAERGFEVYWPELKRELIDTTIYERAPWSMAGLARLLVLEKFFSSETRDTYLDQRRDDRSRPQIPWSEKNKRGKRYIPGDLKGQDRVLRSDWISNGSTYHSQATAVHLPYGVKWDTRRVQKMLFTADIVLNARWNEKNKDLLGLHRHPCFFGTVSEVLHDCCKLCPTPKTDEEKLIHEERCADFVSGELSFMVEDPSRQLMSGSFQPLTDGDWSEQAYMSTVEQLMQRVIENDVAGIKALLTVEDEEAKEKLLLERDYIGRAPLQLALLEHKTEAALALIEMGARITARLIDGRTNFMLAAQTANVAVVEAMLARSAKNEAEANDAAVKAGGTAASSDNGEEQQDGDEDEDEDEEEDEGEDEDEEDEEDEDGAVIVKRPSAQAQGTGDELPVDSNQTLDVIDLAYVAWDTEVTALHYAVLGGSVEVVKLLLEAGADPRKLGGGLYPLTTVPIGITDDEQAIEVMKVLLDAGASSAQLAFYDTVRKQNAGTVVTFFIHARRPRLAAALLEHDSKASTTIDFVTHGEEGYSWAAHAAPLTFALSSGQLGLAAVLLKLGAKTHTKIEQCQALEELPAIRKSRPSWNRRKFDYYADTMQPLEASLTQGNYGYKLLLGANEPPPITAPLSSFLILTPETTLQRASELSKELVTSGAPLLPPTEAELDQALESAVTWRDKLMARIRRDNGLREYKNFAEHGDSSSPALASFMVEEDRKVAEPYVEYFTRVQSDLAARKAPSTWDELLPLLDPPFESGPTRRNIDRGSSDYYHRELLKYRERRQIARSAIEFRTCGADGNNSRADSLARHLYPRAQELFDAAEQGDDATLRRLTLPAADGALAEELLPIAIFAEEPMLEYDRCKVSPLQVALNAGKWETICTIMDICAQQYQAPEEKKSKYSLQVGYGYGSDDDYGCHSDSDEDGDSIHISADADETVTDLDEVGAPRPKLVAVKSSYSLSQLVLQTALVDSLCDAYKLRTGATDREGMRKVFVKILYDTDYSTKRLYGDNTLGAIFELALLVDDPILLMATAVAKGEGLARHFEHAFGDSLTEAQDADEALQVETPSSTANYVGLLVGGKRRAAWAADPNQGPARQLGGSSESLLEMAADFAAAKCMRKLCEGNFKAVRELIDARRSRVAGLVAEESKDEELLKLWEKELRLLNAPDLANPEHLAKAAGAYGFDGQHGNPLGKALIGGPAVEDKQDAAKAAEADKRAVETAEVLLELVPRSMEWLDLPSGGNRNRSAFLQAPSPAIVDWLLSHGATATSRDEDGANVLHICSEQVLAHLCKVLDPDVLAVLLKQKQYGKSAETPLHGALSSEKRTAILLTVPATILADAMRVRGGAHGLTPLGEAVRTHGKNFGLVELMLNAARQVQCLDVLRWEDVVGDLPLEHRERSILLQHTANANRRRQLPLRIRVPGEEKLLDWKPFVRRLKLREEVPTHRSEAGQLAELQWAIKHCGAEMPEPLLKACHEVVDILAEKTKGDTPDFEGVRDHRLLALVGAAMAEVPGPRVRIPPAYVQIAVKQKLDAGDPRYDEPHKRNEDDE